MRGLTIGIISGLAIMLFSIATIALQNTGMHRSVDHNHTVGDWTEYQGDEVSPPSSPRPSSGPSIFTTLTSSDAGIW
jgi:hypothetical protein